MRQAVGTPGEMRRLTIHTESARVDVALPATVAVGLLTPAIVDALAGCSDFNPGQIAVRYRLSTLGGKALEASKTLKELRIRDGTTLALTHSSTEFVAPTSDDAAEAVSTVVVAIERRWSRRAAQLVGALIASCWAGASAVVLLRTALDADGTQRTGCVAIGRDHQLPRSLGSGGRVSRVPGGQRESDTGLDGHRIRRTCRTACRSRRPGRPERALCRGCRGHLRGDRPRDRLPRSFVRSYGVLCDDMLGGRRRMRGRRRAPPSHRCGARGNIVGDDRSIALDVGHARAVVT